VDGEHIYRVRPVTEDSTGHSRISADAMAEDRETIFPLRLPLATPCCAGLFQHEKNVLVEGMSDYYYLHALDQQCRAKGLAGLPEDVAIHALRRHQACWPLGCVVPWPGHPASDPSRC
jgi:hypothetical protein